MVIPREDVALEVEATPAPAAPATEVPPPAPTRDPAPPTINKTRSEMNVEACLFEVLSICTMLSVITI